MKYYLRLYNIFIQQFEKTITFLKYKQFKLTQQ